MTRVTFAALRGRQTVCRVAGSSERYMTEAP